MSGIHLCAAEGVLRTMNITIGFKVAAVLLLAAGLLGVCGTVGYQAWAPQHAAAAQPAKEAKPAASDHDKIQGLWKLTRVEFEGADNSAAELKTRWPG